VINLSIQFLLNCGGDVAGSCLGGYYTGVYQFIKDQGYIPFDTCMSYIACSSDSLEGFCSYVDTTCCNINMCRTCDNFSGMGGKCTEIDYFPNATVAEYGMIPNNVSLIMAEIYARGPVEEAINTKPIVNYKGGVYDDENADKKTNHVVSIVGWGSVNETTIERRKNNISYWIVRNSWGQYWGEMGFFCIRMGMNILGIEDEVAWATPGGWTEVNFPCTENGSNCEPTHNEFTFTSKTIQHNYESNFYTDPSVDVTAMKRRLHVH